MNSLSAETDQFIHLAQEFWVEFFRLATGSLRMLILIHKCFRVDVEVL